MSGVYRCRLRRRIPRPQSPVPSKEVIEMKTVKESPVTIAEEKHEKIIPEPAIVKMNIDTKPVNVSIKHETEPLPAKQETIPRIIERSIIQERPRHNAFHAFESEPLQQTAARRTIHINPLLRRRL